MTSEYVPCAMCHVTKGGIDGNYTHKFKYRKNTFKNEEDPNGTQKRGE